MAGSGRHGGPRAGVTCTVCQHPQLAMIDAALTATPPQTFASIAKSFGLQPAAVKRHGDNHLVAKPASTPAIAPAGWQPPAGASWKEKMEALAAALETGAVRSDVAAQLRLTYKDLDDAGDGGPTAVQVSDVAGLADFLGDLLDVLDEFPQIRERVAASLTKHGLM